MEPYKIEPVGQQWVRVAAESTLLSIVNNNSALPVCMFLFLCVIVRQPSRFAAVTEPKESDKSKRPKNRSVREFFGHEEYCYIMDAKNNGNIGRYLNVSLFNTFRTS
jgi:hypothetical protein